MYSPNNEEASINFPFNFNLSTRSIRILRSMEMEPVVSTIQNVDGVSKSGKHQIIRAAKDFTAGAVGGMSLVVVGHPFK